MVKIHAENIDDWSDFCFFLPVAEGIVIAVTVSLNAHLFTTNFLFLNFVFFQMFLYQIFVKLHVFANFTYTKCAFIEHLCIMNVFMQKYVRFCNVMDA